MSVATNPAIPTAGAKHPNSLLGEVFRGIVQREVYRENVTAFPFAADEEKGQLETRRRILTQLPCSLWRSAKGLEAKYDLDTTEQDPEREIWIFRLDSRVD